MPGRGAGRDSVRGGVIYARHFGFTEPPFSMTPDPRFLYMSEPHREAMAHLLYGLGEGGGFVQLTGEVGTGKTTLCRSLFEQLPPDVDLAVILNPKQTDLELLATVCDELHVAHPLDTTSRKVLVDALYRDLLDAHKRGRRTVLVIDEAQDLAPEVLEQVRLLTNLETSTDKLLKIILIGQPELIPLLDRKDLRQVAQRVTARYHLLPFAEADTRAYIRHRLRVAGQADRVFTDRALRVVHRASGGIPRLINSICDRALLGAYTRDERRVGAVVARRSAREVSGAAAGPRRARAWGWVGAATAAAVIVAGTWALVAAGQIRIPSVSRIQAWTRPATAPDRSPTRSGAAPVPGVSGVAAVAAAPEAPAAAAPDARQSGAPAPRAASLADLMADPALGADRTAAFKSLYALWRLDFDGSGNAPACERGRAEGLHCLFRTGSWAKLRRLDLPAIIELSAPAGGRHYATVVALGEQTATLDLAGRRYTLPLREVDRYWDGPFILVWKVPALSHLPIVPGMRGRDVEWLRRRLDALDGRASGGPDRDLFDADLRARVIAFQRSVSLFTDGIVGEETLAYLTGARRDPSVPRLWRVGS